MVCVGVHGLTNSFNHSEDLNNKELVQTLHFVNPCMCCRRLLAKDRRAEPRNQERVPYVIVYGTPGLPLIQLVKQPHEVSTIVRITTEFYFFLNL